jgi:hypothetical protein
MFAVMQPINYPQVYDRYPLAEKLELLRDFGLVPRASAEVRATFRTFDRTPSEKRTGRAQWIDYSTQQVSLSA